MKLLTFLVSVFALICFSCFICSSCSKSKFNNAYDLQGNELILIQKNWKLLKSDTTRYDSAYNILYQTHFDPSVCENQLHMIFYYDRSSAGYRGCEEPSHLPLDPGTTWDASTDMLRWTTIGPPRAPSEFISMDSIEACTNDSLVLVQRFGPWYPHGGQPFYANYSKAPALIRSLFGREW